MSDVLTCTTPVLSKEEADKIAKSFPGSEIKEVEGGFQVTYWIPEDLYTDLFLGNPGRPD